MIQEGILGQIDKILYKSIVTVVYHIPGNFHVAKFLWILQFNAQSKKFPYFVPELIMGMTCWVWHFLHIIVLHYATTGHLVGEDGSLIHSLKKED